MSRWRPSALSAVFVFSLLATPSPVRSSETTPDTPLTTKVYQVADVVIPLAAGDSKTPDFETLLDLIELRTGADCWSETGGTGTIVTHDSTFSLVIRQTPDMHERIASLLEEIRGASDLALCVEMQFLSGNLDTCEGTNPKRSVQGLVDQSGKEKLLIALQAQSAGSVIAAPRMTFFNGQSGQLRFDGKDQAVAAEVRGVISKDNRYARLWIDAEVNGEETKTELLIPEGHTAVRKLPGKDSWLLVTSRVINAEEPEILIPTKASEAAPQKRYPVPMDESPDPLTATLLPRMKAMAEAFGVTVKVAATVDVDREHVELAESVAAPKPSLVKGVEQVAYQVALAEPCPPAASNPPATLSLVLAGDELTMECPKSDCGGKRRSLEEPAGFVNVALDDLECPTAMTVRSIQPGNFFAEVFAPAAPDDLPLPMPQPAPSQQVRSINISGLDYRFYTPDLPTLQPGTIDQVYGAGFRYPGLAIITGPVFTDHVIEHGDLRPIPQILPSPPAGTTVVRTPDPKGPRGWTKFSIVRPHRLVEQAPSSAVQPASAESVEETASVDEHLAAAARELDELGLDAEAKTVRDLLNTLSLRARRRCEQIDEEISRLKEERTRLESLTPVPAGIKIHLLGTGN